MEAERKKPRRERKSRTAPVSELVERVEGLAVCDAPLTTGDPSCATEQDEFLSADEQETSQEPDPLPQERTSSPVAQGASERPEATEAEEAKASSPGPSAPSAPPLQTPSVAPSAPVASAVQQAPPTASAPPMYPSVSGALAKEAAFDPFQELAVAEAKESGLGREGSRGLLAEVGQEEAAEAAEASLLLSEAQLRNFYANAELEGLEAWLEEDFLGRWEWPTGESALYRALEEFQRGCEELDAVAGKEDDLRDRAAQLSDGLWEVATQTQPQRGVCGEGHSASASVSFTVARLRESALSQLQATNQALRDLHFTQRLRLRNRLLSLEGAVTGEVEARVTAFASHYSITAQSPPFTFPNDDEDGDLEVRSRVRSAIGLLFHFLRLSSRSESFVREARGWLSRLASVLIRAAQRRDNLFLLSQLLRSPVSLTEEGWDAAAWLQPLSVPSSQERLDHFVALLSLLLGPVSCRRRFLEPGGEGGERKQSREWTLLDEEGEEEPSRAAAVPDEDLAALLAQFSFDDFFAAAFTEQDERGVSGSRILSLVVLELSVLGVLFQGLSTYREAAYRGFCRRLGYMTRRSVQYVGEYVEWALRSEAGAVEEGWRERLGLEFERVLVVATTSVLSASANGMGQFLVDFPLHLAGPDSQWRLLALLLGLADGETVWYTSTSSVQEQLARDAEVLLRELESSSSSSSEAGAFVVAALAGLGARSSSWEVSLALLRQLHSVALCGRSQWEKEARLGAEALLKAQPALLSHLLRLIAPQLNDGHESAGELVPGALLKDWSPSENDLLLVGKWVVAFPPLHPASKTGLRILAGLNWGFGSRGSLHISLLLHSLVAETLLKLWKAFLTENRAKLTRPQAAGLETFLWSLLLRLKLSTFQLEKEELDEADALPLHFVLARQTLEGEPVAQLSAAAVLSVAEVLRCGPERARVVLAQRLVERTGRGAWSELRRSETLLPLLEAAARDSDEGVVCAALLSGVAETSTGRWASLLLSASGGSLGERVRPMLEAVAAKAFLLSEGRPEGDLVDVLRDVWEGQVEAWKLSLDAPGLLSWITGLPPTPALLPPDRFGDSPYLAFFAIAIQEEASAETLALLAAELSRKTDGSLADCLRGAKEAGGRDALLLTPESLPHRLWARLLCDAPLSHPILPLVAQRLLLSLLRKHSLPQARGLHCLGLRFLRDPPSQAALELLKSRLQSLRAHFLSAEAGPMVEFYQAVELWLWDPRLYSPYDSARVDLDQMPMDHLLPLLTSENADPWLNFVPIEELREALKAKADAFAAITAELPYQAAESRSSSSQLRGSPSDSALHRLIRRLQRLGGEEVKVPPPRLRPSQDAGTPQRVLVDGAEVEGSVAGPALEALRVGCRDWVRLLAASEGLDEELLQLGAGLWQDVRGTKTIVFRCGRLLGCAKPSTHHVPVIYSIRSDATARQIEGNRDKHRRDLASLQSQLFQPNAFGARIRSLSDAIGTMCRLATSAQGGDLSVRLEESGVRLFRLLLLGCEEDMRLCPCGEDVLRYWTQMLGESFVSGVAARQGLVVELAEASPAPDLATAHLSPAVLAPADAVQLLGRTLRSGQLSRELKASLVSKFQMSDLVAGGRWSGWDVEEAMRAVLESGDPSLAAACASFWLDCAASHFPSLLPSALRLLLQAPPFALALIPPMSHSLPQLQLTQYQAIVDAAETMSAGLSEGDAWELFGSVCSELVSLSAWLLNSLPKETPASARWGQLWKLLLPWLRPSKQRSDASLTPALELMAMEISTVDRSAEDFCLESFLWDRLTLDLSPCLREAEDLPSPLVQVVLCAGWPRFQPSLAQLASLVWALESPALGLRALGAEVLVRLPLGRLAERWEGRRELGEAAEALTEALVLAAADAEAHRSCRASLASLAAAVGELGVLWRGLRPAALEVLASRLAERHHLSLLVDDRDVLAQLRRLLERIFGLAGLHDGDDQAKPQTHYLRALLQIIAKERPKSLEAGMVYVSEVCERAPEDVAPALANDIADFLSDNVHMASAASEALAGSLRRRPDWPLGSALAERLPQRASLEALGAAASLAEVCLASLEAWPSSEGPLGAAKLAVLLEAGDGLWVLGTARALAAEPRPLAQRTLRRASALLERAAGTGKGPAAEGPLWALVLALLRASPEGLDAVGPWLDKRLAGAGSGGLLATLVGSRAGPSESFLLAVKLLRLFRFGATEGIRAQAEKILASQSSVSDPAALLRFFDQGASREDSEQLLKAILTRLYPQLYLRF